jgi:RecB family endonuclease NucS
MIMLLNTCSIYFNSKKEKMYQIDKNQNNILSIKEATFASLHYKERENLQEWIAKNPNIFGEDLLIIQKEFDWFSDTKERLDLLAIDKEWNLVVIENKLDDTWRDVVWQASKICFLLFYIKERSSNRNVSRIFK